LIVALFDCVL